MCGCSRVELIEQHETSTMTGVSLLLRLSPLGGGDQWSSLCFRSKLVLLSSLYHFDSGALSILYLLSVGLSLSHDFDL